MISDEELEQLPEDPELAFVAFEKIAREYLFQAEKDASEGQYDADPYRLEYINKVLAAARAYGIGGLSEWQVPSANSNVYADYRQFTADVDHFTTQIRIKHAPRKREGSVGLDQKTKTKIYHYVEQIKESIAQADLPDDKRDTLLDKLNNFVKALDRKRTGLDAGMSIYIAVCDGIGQGFEKLEPARRWIDSIAALLGRAKDEEEKASARLPKPAEPKKLEPPRKQIAPPKKAESDLDDDIPF